MTCHLFPNNANQNILLPEEEFKLLFCYAKHRTMPCSRRKRHLIRNKELPCLSAVNVYPSLLYARRRPSSPLFLRLKDAR